jgi:hypothetical protein
MCEVYTSLLVLFACVCLITCSLLPIQMASPASSFHVVVRSAPALCGFMSLDAYVHATVHVLLLTGRSAMGAGTGELFMLVAICELLLHMPPMSAPAFRCIIYVESSPG